LGGEGVAEGLHPVEVGGRVLELRLGVGYGARECFGAVVQEASEVERNGGTIAKEGSAVAGDVETAWLNRAVGGSGPASEQKQNFADDGPRCRSAGNAAGSLKDFKGPRFEEKKPLRLGTLGDEAIASTQLDPREGADNCA
jgi:hypothetical protein